MAGVTSQRVRSALRRCWRSSGSRRCPGMPRGPGLLHRRLSPVLGQPRCPSPLEQPRLSVGFFVWRRIREGESELGIRAGAPWGESSPGSGVFFQSFQLRSGCGAQFAAAARALCVDGEINVTEYPCSLACSACGSVLSHALEQLWFCLSLPWPSSPGIPGNRCSGKGPGALLSTESVCCGSKSPARLALYWLRVCVVQQWEPREGPSFQTGYQN